MHKAAPWPTGLCAPVRVPPALLLGGAGGAARQEEDVRPSMVQRDKGVLVPDPPPTPLPSSENFESIEKENCPRAIYQ